MINNQQDIDKICLYAKDPYEDKYQYLINKRQRVGINHLNDPKAFIEYSIAFDKQIKTIEDQGKKQVDALNTLKSDNKITIKNIHMILMILHLSLNKKKYLIKL